MEYNGYESHNCATNDTCDLKTDLTMLKRAWFSKLVKKKSKNFIQIQFFNKFLMLLPLKSLKIDVENVVSLSNNVLKI